MPSFLVQVSYTSEATAALIKRPQDRSRIVGKAVEKLGGIVKSAWLSFGDYDTVVLVDMPDNVSAAAFALAVSAGGSCKAIKTTPLLSVEEGMDAMKKAGRSGYKPVS
ncbi:MAG TPA: GYD domain-containing protein [Terracidiphilus sp.]|nr:GYD domain-containing protein [Terracidiphilus sp.]